MGDDGGAAGQNELTTSLAPWLTVSDGAVGLQRAVLKESHGILTPLAVQRSR